MSSATTLSKSEHTILSASPVTTTSSSVSVVSLPGPTHTPSQTPVIAGSLTGVIVLVVCLATLLLLHKRRRQLRAERILRATQQYSNSPNLSGRHIHKRPSLNGYGEPPPPRTQDSASSSGSSAPSPSGVSPFTYTPNHLHQLPHENSPHDLTPKHHRPSSGNRSIHSQDHHHQPLAPMSIPIHQLARSPSSSVRSHKPSLSPSQSHRAAIPLQHIQPSVNVPQIVSELSAPHDHVDGAGAGVALDNNNTLVSTNPRAIFGSARRSSDAGERTVTRQDYDVTNAGIFIIVVARDFEQEEYENGGDDGGRGPWTDAAGESRPIAANGVVAEVHNGHGNEGWRSGRPDISGGYGHIQGYTQRSKEDRSDVGQRVETSNSHASSSEPEHSYLPAASGSGGYPKQRIADPYRGGFVPDFALSINPIIATDSGSLAPSSVFGTSVSSASLPAPPNVAGQYTRQRSYANQKSTTTANNSQLVPSARAEQNRPYLGHIQAPIALSHLGARPPIIEEDAPPAYENACAPTREVVAERRRPEQPEPRTL